MVTIEQKLTLFSKLLHQDIKDEIDKKLTELDKEYEKRITRNKDKVDKEAGIIIEKAMRRAEAKKVEIISKGKLSAKKEALLTKEKYINTFMETLKGRIQAFIQTDSYKAFLKHHLMQFQDLQGYENALVIYMTQADYQTNKDYIKDILISLGLGEDKLGFEIAGDAILGGVILSDPKLNMRIDASIEALLDDTKNLIIESLFAAIGEAGGILG